MVEINALKSSVLTSTELSSTTNWPVAVIEDYLNLVNNFVILSTIFQMFNNGTVTTTGAFVTITDWDIDKNKFGFTEASGEISINETGEYVLDASVLGDGATQLEVQVQLFDGSTWNTIKGGFDTGTFSAKIPGLIFSASVSQKVRLQVKHVGASVDINPGNARLTLGRRG